VHPGHLKDRVAPLPESGDEKHILAVHRLARLQWWLLDRAVNQLARRCPLHRLQRNHGRKYNS
jgi:hypothetical protein